MSYQKIVARLDELVKTHNWQGKFEAAIEKANSYNIPTIRHVRTYREYLDWLDAMVVWAPSENIAGKKIYDKLCEFHFFLDQSPVLELQNKVVPHDKQPPLTPLSQWMVEFADTWGAFLDTTESINAETLRTFKDSPTYNYDEYMPPPSGYLTFNQFFARHVKPGMRPVAALDDPRVIVSAADSTFLASYEVNDNSRIYVKGIEWSVLELLADSPYRDRFKGGIFLHSFLGPNDYHRLHVPMAGRVLESRVIPGQVYLQVVAKPAGNGEHQLAAIRQFDAPDSTGYQFAQARGLLVLETTYGLVAVLPIGMCQVSSVVMTADVGKVLHKGEEFAYFQFGGSDHVIVFESSVGVQLTMRENVHYNQGTVIGNAYPVI